jgi:hypothetical protein
MVRAAQHARCCWSEQGIVLNILWLIPLMGNQVGFALLDPLLSGTLLEVRSVLETSSCNILGATVIGAVTCARIGLRLELYAGLTHPGHIDF